MNLFKTTLTVLGTAAVAILSSCVQYTAENPPTPNPKQTEIPKAVFVNPYPVGTYAHFRARPDYRKTYEIWKNKALLDATPPTQTRIVISLSTQRGVLYKGNEPIMDYPVATGKRAFPTPTGDYRILEKKQFDKRSNLYGKIYNAEGKVIKSDADSNKDAGLIATEGNRFQGAMMKYWMRLTWDGIGMHQGRVPRYPASHGCIRTYSKAVSTVFRKVQNGTPVSIVR